MAADRLVVIAAAVLATGCNALLGPSPPSKDWSVHESGRFSLYVRPGSFCDTNAEAIDRALEDQYAFALTALDLQLDRHISGFLYEPGSDASRLSLSDASGVAYVQTAAFNAVCTPPLAESVFVVVQHESNHVIESSALGRPGTHFLNEGLASALISERYHRLGKTFFFAWTRDHRAQIPRLADLSNDDRWVDINQRTAYNAAASFLAYMLDVYGPQGIKMLYAVRSEELADRVRGAYGKSLQDLEAEWLRFCDAFSAPP